MKFGKKSEFYIEIIIFIIGSAISLLSLVSNGDNSQLMAIIIFVITLSTDIIIIALKFYVKSITGGAIEQIDKMLASIIAASFGYLLHDDKINERWREKSIQIFAGFRNKVQGLYEGRLILDYEELFNYQNELIKSTIKYLDAIHIADNIEALQLWNPVGKETSRFKRATYYACQELNADVIKRRLFIIKKDLEVNDPELIKQVVKDQEDNLHFEVKKLYIEDVSGKINIPHDLIICDREEVIEIIMRYGKVESAYDYVNLEDVEKFRESFEKFWNMADSFSIDDK